MLVVCSDAHVLGSPLMSAEATRMQDLASEFQKKKFPHSHPASGRARGVGTQTLVPLNFSAVVAPQYCRYVFTSYCLVHTFNNIVVTNVINVIYNFYKNGLSKVIYAEKVIYLFFKK